MCGFDAAHDQPFRFSHSRSLGNRVARSVSVSSLPSMRHSTAFCLTDRTASSTSPSAIGGIAAGFRPGAPRAPGGKGWYYLDDKIRFPFQAKCIVAEIVSPLRKGETVEVQRMAPEDACSADMLVLIGWHGRTMAVPLSQLTVMDADDPTAEAIADWHYWVAQGYSF